MFLVVIRFLGYVILVALVGWRAYLNKRFVGGWVLATAAVGITTIPLSMLAIWLILITLGPAASGQRQQCPWCGGYVETEDKYCMHCGKYLQGDKE